MSILSHVRMPEHDQSSVGSVVFGVSDPADRPLFPRWLVVDIVAAAVEVLDVDADQDQIVDHLIEAFADRIIVTDAPRPAELATAQRAAWHVDVSDEAFAELAARAAYGCEDCGHLPGCDCECCPYQMPAVAGAEQLVGGAR